MSVFKDFQKVFTKYQNLFGLNGYKVYFKEEPIADNFADILVYQEAMIATVRLSNPLPVEEKPYQNIHNNAKHEALHLLVARLSDNAQYRYTTKSDIQEAEEELVRRLEKLIPDIKEVK